MNLSNVLLLLIIIFLIIDRFNLKKQLNLKINNIDNIKLEQAGYVIEVDQNSKHFGKYIKIENLSLEHRFYNWNGGKIKGYDLKKYRNDPSKLIKF